MRVVIDHIAGARRGQRQDLDAPAEGCRVRFGRHPECEVAFDPYRDRDASSRHAELRGAAGGWLLVDLGSSNGTYVNNRRVTEAPVAANEPLHLEFGSGGPRVRLFVGEATAIAQLPPPVLARRRPVWLWLAGGGLLLLLVLFAAHCT